MTAPESHPRSTALSFERYCAIVDARSVIVSKDDFIVDVCRGRSVLDVGCVDHSLETSNKLGDYWLHHRLAEAAGEIVGIDILAAEAAALNQRGYNIIAADAQTMALGRRFERVVLGDIIEHVENPGQLLKAARQHLEPGGHILVATPNPFFGSRMLTILLKNVYTVNDEHVTWFDPRTLFRLAERAGLAVVDFRWTSTRGVGLKNMPGWRGGVARFLLGQLESRHSMCRGDFLLTLVPAVLHETSGGEETPGE